jgi:hypothetical protein
VTHWLGVWKGLQARMRPPKVKMRTPSPTFNASLVKFAETLVSKPRKNPSERPSTIEHPFQKLADPPADPKDEIASGTFGIEAKMDPTPRLVTHHFERCQF